MRAPSPSPSWLARRGRFRRIVALPVLVVLLLLGTAAAGARAGVTAAGSELAPAALLATPGRITLQGHGWGHGRGMGQWGAFGYARDHGWTHSQILQHFYGGTNPASVDPATPLTVWLKQYDDRPLIVYSASSFTVAGILVEGTAMVRREGSQWVLYTAARGANNCLQSWGAPTVLGAVTTPVQVALTSDPGDDIWRMLGVCTAEGIRHYRGALDLVLSSVPRVVNRVGVDAYIRGVVPRESPASWPAAALRSQAVAARSYALSEGGESGARFAWAKTCDDIFCQVYGGAGFNGVRLEHANTDAAVAATSGEVRRHTDGRLSRTEFSSSTGGYTNGTPACSTCSFPAVPDAGDDASPLHDWTTTIPYADLERVYDLGTFVDIAVTSRNGLGDWGGRARQVQVVGTSRTVTVDGNTFRQTWGLRSDWFQFVYGLSWYIRNSNTDGPESLLLRYGNRGDLPVVGDWNGDHRAGIGTFLNGMWYLRDSQAQGPAEVAFRYGNPGDLPVVGDWNGDGHDSIGTFRDGVWYLRNSATPGPPEIVVRYGVAGDRPVVGDWDGVGGDGIGTNLNATWYLRDLLSDGPAQIVFRYGNPQDTPVPGDWNGDAQASAGAVLDGRWYLRNAPGSGGAADVPPFGFGLSGDRFLTGDFDGNGTDTPVAVRG